MQFFSRTCGGFSSSPYLFFEGPSGLSPFSIRCMPPEKSLLPVAHNQSIRPGRNGNPKKSLPFS